MAVGFRDLGLGKQRMCLVPKLYIPVDSRHPDLHSIAQQGFDSDKAYMAYHSVWGPACASRDTHGFHAARLGVSIPCDLKHSHDTATDSYSTVKLVTSVCTSQLQRRTTEPE